MEETVSKKTRTRRGSYLRLFHELVFSTYFALLIVTLHEAAMGLFSWSIRLRNFYVSHRYPNIGTLMDDDYRVNAAAFLLVWLSAAAIFLCLRLFARFSFTKTVLRTFAGVVALAGFPLASLYYGDGRMPFLQIELAITAACVILWAHRKWPVSAPLNIFLLVLHFALWASFSTFPGVVCCILFWPGWDWVWQNNDIAHKIRLVYPLLGFCSTLLWAAYFRQSEVGRLPVHSIAKTPPD